MAHRIRSLSLLFALAVASSFLALPADAGRRNYDQSVVQSMSGTTSRIVPAVPEPGAIAAFAVGAAVIALAARKMRRNG